MPVSGTGINSTERTTGIRFTTLYVENPVTLPAADLVEICSKHGINPAHRAEFFALALHGRRPGIELQNRLKYVTNYKAALDEVLGRLSLPYAKFAADPSFVPFTRFESLVIGEFA